MFSDNRTNHIEFQGHRSKVKVTWIFWLFFGVRDAAATRGQYLALSKVWWFCCLLNSACRR